MQIEGSACKNCGNGIYEYDSYWNEYSCEECGYTVNDLDHIELLEKNRKNKAKLTQENSNKNVQKGNIEEIENQKVLKRNDEQNEIEFNEVIAIQRFTIEQKQQFLNHLKIIKELVNDKFYPLLNDFTIESIENLSDALEIEKDKIKSQAKDLISELIIWLEDENGMLRENAAAVLELLGWTPENEHEEVSFSLACNDPSRLSSMSDETINLLYEVAKSEKSWLSKSAVDLLCNSEDSRAGEVLKKLLLLDQKKDVREEVISRFTPSYVYDPVPQALGSKGCTEQAIKYLSDPDIGSYAQKYLARYPAAEAIPGIIQLIKNSDSDYWIHQELVTTLGNSLRGSKEFMKKGTISNEIYECLKILASRGDSEAQACIELTEQNQW